MNTTTERDLINLANSRMTIVEACDEVGVMYASGYTKTWCPFGDLYHKDGGHEKAFRVYPETNSAWCFAGCGYYTPVKLLAADKGVSESEAAEIILVMTKYVEPTVDSRWEAATNIPEVVDYEALTVALMTYCARIEPEWEVLQFDDRIASTLTKCLAPLGKVKNEQDARKWLNATKEIMRKVMEK